jgi:hypothetical protein
MFKVTAIAASLAVLLSAAAPTVSFAADAPAKAGPTNPWIECGIGAMIFPKTPVGAVISNVIWDYGLTATTSMVSSPDMCEGTRTKTAMFINTNYPQLAAEAAIGRGEHLVAMGKLMNCDSAAQTKMLTAMRSEMPDMVSAEGFDSLTDTHKAEALFKVIDRVTQSSKTSCNLA